MASTLKYDSNANIQFVKWKRSGDFTLVISPGVDISEEMGRVTLSGRYTPSGFIYFSNPQLDNVSHSASADMKVNVSEMTTMELSDVFSYSTESLQANLIGIQTPRGSMFVNTASLGVNHTFTPRTTAFLSLADSVLNSNVPSALTNIRTDSAAAGVGYNATENTALTASYSATNFSFHSPGGKNSVLDHAIQAGFSRRFPYLFEFSLSGGASYTPAISTDSYIFIGSARLKKSFENSAVTVGVARGITDTSGLTNELNVHDSVTLDWKQELTQTVDIDLSGTYSKNRTRPTVAVNLDSYVAGITGNWRPYSWMTLSAGVSHFQQWVAEGSLGGNITRDGVFVSISVTTYERRF